MKPIRSLDLLRARPVAGIAVLALALAACSTPTPAASSASPSTPPFPSASPATATPSASPSARPSLPPSPTPSASPGSADAPAGPWSSLAWIDAGKLPLGSGEITVHGWSGGFVALEQTGGYDNDGNELPVVIRASAPTDGIHWSAPADIDTARFKGNIAIASIVEGPAGLLALAYPYGDTCGGPASVVALWSSTDGSSWDRVSLPKSMTSGQVQTIAGGSAGYIAFGSQADSTKAALWTSQDGRAWQSRALPTVATGTLVLDGATSFDGGFVVAGSVLGEEGCGGAAHVRAATWWSADGAGWTRAKLPGSLSDANARLSVRPVTNKVLLAIQTSGDGETRLAWTSSDGRTWTSVEPPSELVELRAVGNGLHTGALLEPEGSGSPTVIEVREDGRPKVLDQTGSGPVVSEDGPTWSLAIGRTGLLVYRFDGGSVFLGVPS